MNDSFLVTTIPNGIGGNDYEVKKTRASDCIPLFLYIYPYMKYIITESQITNIIYSYLDSQDFIEIKIGDNIYFVTNEGDEYAKIRFTNYFPSKWVGVSNELCDEISSFFPINKSDCDKIVGEWIRNKFKMGGTFITQQYLKDYPPILKVPY